MKHEDYHHQLSTLALDEAKQREVIAAANLQLAKITVAYAELDIKMKSGATEAKPEADLKEETEAKSEEKVKAKRKAKQEQNDADVAKVKAAAEKATTAPKVDADLSLVYKEGKVNMLGFLSPLRHLSTERRKPYIEDVEIDKTKHTQALEHGVMDLDLVQEVINASGTKAKIVEGTPRVTKEAVVNMVGADLLEHMAQRVGKDSLQLDVKDIFLALKKAGV